MKTKVEQILNELYEIDSSLKDKEKDLKKIIIKMIETKPDIKVDESFKNELRKNIEEKIMQNKISAYKWEKTNNFFHTFSYIFWSVWVLAFSFIFINSYLNDDANIKTNDNIQTENSITQDKKYSTLSFKNNIIKKEKNYFWNLNSLEINESAWVSWRWWAMLESWMATQEISLDSMEADESVSNTPLLKDSKMSIMPAPEDYIPTILRYSFSWELNIDLENEMPVYKKTTSKLSWENIIDEVSKLNFNWFNLSNFKDLNLSNLSVSEDRKYWYTINIDMESASLNIYKNYLKWPQEDYNNKPEILPEDEIINIANNFVKEYNIDLSNYSKPVVETQYLSILRESSSSKIAPDFYSRSTSVTYPLIVDWNEISEEYGQKKWIQLQIDLNEKKVTSVNWIQINDYISSLYEVETSKENILKVAQKWWRMSLENNLEENYDEVKYIDQTLTNPRLEYINIYKYVDNNQEEYIVPAIIFDVESDMEDNFYWQERVSVPLVKDFYEYDNSWNVIWNNEE